MDATNPTKKREFIKLKIDLSEYISIKPIYSFKVATDITFGKQIKTQILIYFFVFFQNRVFRATHFTDIGDL